MMNSIISLNNMISEALECVDAERNAKTRKKSHASKSRKQDFSRAKRHAASTSSSATKSSSILPSTATHSVPLMKQTVS